MNFGYVIADDGESTGPGGSITGSGTIGYLPAFTGTSSIGNSPIYTTGGSVAIGTATIQATAIFQIDSTSKGFLPPRVTTVQKNAIGAGTVAEGLVVYDTTLKSLNFYNGTSWSSILGNDWVRGGNSFGAVSKIGSADNFAIQIITNNTVAATFNTAQSLGLGVDVASITAVLHIKAGTAAANTAPLKFTSGVNLTTPEAGAFEYNGTNLFFTRVGTTRQTVLTANVITTEVVVSDTTVTVNIDGVNLKLLARA